MRSTITRIPDSGPREGENTFFRGLALISCGALWMMAAAAAAGQNTKPDQAPKYDPGAEVEVIATVLEVQEAPPSAAMSGIHLTVKTKSETMKAYLGPADFLKEFEVTFAKGDTVHLTGSRVRWGTGRLLLTRELRKHGTTVYLRDKQGIPYWATGDKGA